MQEEWLTKTDPHHHWYQTEEVDRLRRWLSLTLAHRIFPDPLMRLDERLLNSRSAFHSEEIKMAWSKYDAWMNQWLSSALSFYEQRLGHASLPVVSEEGTLAPSPFLNEWVQACIDAQLLMMTDPAFSEAIAHLLSMSAIQSDESKRGHVSIAPLFQKKNASHQEAEVLRALDHAMLSFTASL